VLRRSVLPFSISLPPSVSIGVGGGLGTRIWQGTCVDRVAALLDRPDGGKTAVGVGQTGENPYRMVRLLRQTLAFGNEAGALQVLCADYLSTGEVGPVKVLLGSKLILPL